MVEVCVDVLYKPQKDSRLSYIFVFGLCHVIILLFQDVSLEIIGNLRCTSDQVTSGLVKFGPLCAHDFTIFIWI